MKEKEKRLRVLSIQIIKRLTWVWKQQWMCSERNLSTSEGLDDEIYMSSSKKIAKKAHKWKVRLTLYFFLFLFTLGSYLTNSFFFFLSYPTSITTLSGLKFFFLFPFSLSWFLPSFYFIYFSNCFTFVILLVINFFRLLFKYLFNYFYMLLKKKGVKESL